ncbi:MAG: hypothetical protein LBK99_15315 [Opitutaceae bacterium]|nr:hypothetical protein [Opitutaceae bacterium]
MPSHLVGPENRNEGLLLEQFQSWSRLHDSISNQVTDVTRTALKWRGRLARFRRGTGILARGRREAPPVCFRTSQRGNAHGLEARATRSGGFAVSGRDARATALLLPVHFLKCVPTPIDFHG